MKIVNQLLFGLTVGLLLLGMYFASETINGDALIQAWRENPTDATVGAAAYSFAMSGLTPAWTIDIPFTDNPLYIAYPDSADIPIIIILAFIGIGIALLLPKEISPYLHWLFRFLTVITIVIAGWLIYKIWLLPSLLCWGSVKIGISCLDAFRARESVINAVSDFSQPLLIIAGITMASGLTALLKGMKNG